MPKPPPPPAAARPSANDQILQQATFALAQNPGEAAQLAERVLKADRSNFTAAIILGRALMLMNRAEEAIVPLERAARRSSDPSAETLLAAALAAARRGEDAIRQIRQTTARRPAFPPAFLEHAKQLDMGGKTDEAIAVIESALALAPGTTELQLVLARLLVGRNDRARARELLLQASAAASHQQDLLVELAHVMMRDGDYAAAADTYRRALALRPDDAATRANYGVSLMEMGKRDAGEASIREAARGIPQMTGRAIMSLAMPSHGRFFLRPSTAAKFLRK